MNNNHNTKIYYHGSLRDGVIGFIFSAFLTVIPFYLVILDFLQNQQIKIFIIVLCALAQIFVHLVYFLHINLKSEDGWNFIAMIFTFIIVCICFFGSLWIMYHLNNNMMPMDPMNIVH
ncbi:cytochrome o ubiquinol oxidase subunit IV [Candidatus Liberibacter americanus]|uniref:Cytochrome bo(3) ubiquinol oxidase subunit 4 n=1 Tax=Candidatus Liberibacter americanus str. Sao Paulo TaxID=1261131 RepID=U6B6I6_9HYPH|nr:cytochrome o ubiquinol oxidase subunit IV [Candidatus Liberibacter americanus]AHA27481.1 Heme/copper-type cytochrome/quinol oxidase, subunit 4 [Candidatus Liberibacter americanus str. Sao Paulo]EMS36557.1 cytochrome o ubiquinol oxidase subunit IV [Candidatus Liberibacter americanus PW_SP]